MSTDKPLVAILANEVAPRTKQSIYPSQFIARVQGREKRQLGEAFGLRNFGVNLTRLAPGAVSALRHAHTLQDEFIYVLQGHPTLHTNAGATQLSPGMCAGFKAGSGDAHQLANETNDEVVFLEVGDRTAGDTVTYPDDDLQANMVGGQWQFSHTDGTPY